MTDELHNRVHKLEITIGALEWLMWSMRGVLVGIMPDNGGLPNQMELKDDSTFEYFDIPQLPVSERNALIMLWCNEGKTAKEIALLLYSRGHCTKRGALIKRDTIQRVIDKALAKGGGRGAQETE